MRKNKKPSAAEETLRRVFVYNGGFLTQKRTRRIMQLAGYDIAVGKPGPDDAVAVWGQSPTAPRGEAVAKKTESPLIRVEDAFLRSVLTGRDGDEAMGLHIDENGVHFDANTRSDLERLLAEHPLDNTALLNRAKDAIAHIQHLQLSKYNAFDFDLAAPVAGYVLVIDQTRKDASVQASGADSNTFKEMLYYAQAEHPGKTILIKAHPETTAGHRDGYFKDADCNERVQFCDAALPPYTLFEGAIAVYTVSSQMGFEAILTGHKPVVFGQPFYIGWGLSDDRKPLDRRKRNLTRVQLFAATMILYPTWYDPYRDTLCEIEDVIANLAAQARCWRDDNLGWNAHGMRLWKRKPLQQFFGRYKQMRFAADDASEPTTATPQMIWANKDLPAKDYAIAVEDGFLRSKGLGAQLIPPLSLVLDDLGIYYDPSQPSRLEALIEDSRNLPHAARTRAENLMHRIIKSGLSKYNTGSNLDNLDLPKGRRILVPGQVEDDASVRLGGLEVQTNLALLQMTRAANPAATILYKPHPDVEADLRPGHVTDADKIADVILTNIDPVAAIAQVDEVWTMTSLLGFEALLRGTRVTCLGSPFYAGWGLTDDRAAPIARRAALPDLTALVHAVLIDYPRYHDPVTGRACPVEVIIDRLESDTVPQPGRYNRALSKLQGLFASYAHLWR